MSHVCKTKCTSNLPTKTINEKDRMSSIKKIFQIVYDDMFNIYEHVCVWVCECKLNLYFYKELPFPKFAWRMKICPEFKETKWKRPQNKKTRRKKKIMAASYHKNHICYSYCHWLALYTLGNCTSETSTLLFTIIANLVFI